MSNLENFQKSSISQRLRELRGDLTRADFAEKYNISYSTYGNYERGENIPDAKFLKNISDVLNVDIHWLVTGKGHKEASSQEILAPDHIDSKYHVAVPHCDAVASAGKGLTVFDEETIEEFVFPRLLLKDLGVNPDCLCFLGTAGNSMTPTIPEQAILLISNDKAEPFHSGSIYVLRINDDLYVKRLHKRIDGTLELHSDNTQYEKETLSKELLKDVEIIGRVVWFGSEV